MNNRFSLSGDLLMAIVKTIDEGIIVHDKEGKVVVFNKQAQQILQCPEELILGLTVYEFPCPMIKADGSAFPLKEYPASVTLATGQPMQGVRMGVKTEGGAVIWISINSKMIDVGPTSYVFITLNNISSYINANTQLNDIIDTIDDIVFELTTSGTILNVWTNDPAKLFMPKEMFFGKAVFEIFPPVFAAEMLKYFETTLQTGAEQKTEYQNPFDPADKRWFQARFRKTKNQNENVTLLIKEVTERKKAEAEILTLKDRLVIATKAAGVGIWEWDILSNEIIWDDNMRLLFRMYDGGYKDEKEAWKKSVYPDDLTRVEEKIKKAIDDKIEFEDEFKIKWPCGQTRYIKVNSAVVRSENGRPLKMIGTNWDITEVTTKKQELLESQLTFRNTFEYSSIGIALLDISGKWMEVNDALCRLIGYSREELLNSTFQEITYPDDLDMDMTFVGKMLNNEIDTYQLEKRYLHKNGEIIWALLSVSLIRDIDNVPKFFISQIIDITENKKLIEELGEKNKVLQITTIDLEQKIKQLQEFSHIIAHNLRGPATGLMTISDFIIDADNEEERQFMLSQLKEKSELIISTLNDLKDVVEMRLNKEIAFTECSFEQAIVSVKRILENKIKEKGAVIETNLHIAALQYPKAYFDSIMYNLISNAVKYTQHGVIPVIKVHTYMQDERIILEVADNGLGIDLLKYGNQIFKYKKIFHRGFESTGLGLFITKNQVETFGGSISVSSGIGEGSVFKVVFNDIYE
jgi:PAS domain S-box-containing protein